MMSNRLEKAAQDTTNLDRIRVVLINTTHPGNIGATARAMKVMGLHTLHLVTPKTFPHADATALASGADDLLQHAVVHDSLDSALAGCSLVLGTSARLRSLPMPMYDARRAAAQAWSEAQGGEVAILFGRERYGLTNEEMIEIMNKILKIFTNSTLFPDFLCKFPEISQFVYTSLQILIVCTNFSRKSAICSSKSSRKSVNFHSANDMKLFHSPNFDADFC